MVPLDLVFERNKPSMLKKIVTFLRWFFGLKKKEFTQPPPKMSVAAVVPAYNEAANIAATIRSLQAQTYPLDAIFVVDDCSSDNTGDIARALGATVIRPNKNQGTKAQAQNCALPHITSDVFMTVDADTIVAPNGVYEAMRAFNNPNTEVVHGSVLPQRIKTFWEYARLIEYLFARAIIKPAQEHNNMVMVASGCFSIFRTKTVLMYGGFEPRTMVEDFDMTCTIHEDGGDVRFESGAVCFAMEPATLKVYVSQLDRWYRGFFQVLKVRNYRPFKHNLRMRFVLYFYLFWYAISAFIVPLSIFAFTQSFLTTLLGLLAVSLVLVWIPSLYSGMRIGIPWWKIVLGFGPHLVVPYVNMYVYFRSFWREVVANEKLTVWEKGH